MKKLHVTETLHSFVPPEEAAWNLKNCLQQCHSSCIVGIVGTRFWKTVNWSALYSCNNAGLFMDILIKRSKLLQQNWRNHNFYCKVRSSFWKPGTYITHNAAQSLSLITVSNLSDYMQRPLEPLKDLYFFSCIYIYIYIYIYTHTQ